MTAVQIVREVHRRIVVDVYVGSARNDVELRVLLNKAYDLLYADQLVLDFDLSVARDIEQSLTVESMTARVLQDVFAFAWLRLGFDAVYPVQSVFARTVFARVAQPSSKSQIPAVLKRLGLPSVHRNTVSAAGKVAFDEDKNSVRCPGFTGEWCYICRKLFVWEGSSPQLKSNPSHTNH